jgi:endonuclease/exonuclease/phosphatase family metal-dependent hydrolase
MRLATFNILHGRGLRDGVVNLDRLAAAVRSLDADILALQEVDRDQPRSHLADLTAVAAEAMGAVTHRFAAALAGTPGATWIAASERDVPGTASYGVALLSRYPALSWQVLHLPRIPVRFPLYLPTPRKVVMVHEEPRAVVIGHLDTPAGPVVVANTHLSFVPGWGRRQLHRIKRDLSTVEGPVLLMGDLNMGGNLPSKITGYRSLARHLTFPLDRPDRQLDHILLRGELGQVTSSSAPALPLSDHRALVVDLESNEGAKDGEG